MSYLDLYAGGAWNRRAKASTGYRSEEQTPEEALTWALLEQAIDDTTILCRYGLIDAEGNCKPWPLVEQTDHRGHRNNVWMVIATMRDPHQHTKLRAFWNEPDQAQSWCDLCGCRLPAKDIWKSILKHHAK